MIPQLKTSWTLKLYQNISKNNGESALLRTGLSREISRVSYFKFNVISFCGQNRKAFEGWGVVGT